MARALQLATFGGSRVSPNPFVGAVIVHGDRIIGEGYHRNYGGPHAEPNAIRSVAQSDRPLLRESTMYVTLEPCSHFGKTPPCASLIVDTGIPRVVVATLDPFLKQYRSGVDVMRDAGVEVTVGIMEEEARHLNRRFFTAHTLRRPYVLLKWAQTANGYMAGKNQPLQISSPLTKVLMHRERSFYDAIMVGTETVICDNPRLDCRLWPVRDGDVRPHKAGYESPRLPQDSKFARSNPILKRREESLEEFLHRLYADFGITSLMVEGGRKTLQNFIDSGLYDEVRVETALDLQITDGIPAPTLPPIRSRNEGNDGPKNICFPPRHTLLGNRLIVKNY